MPNESETQPPRSGGSAAVPCSVVGWFAVASEADGEDGWFGPHKTKEAAVRDMLSNWIGDPLTQCLVARGHLVTPETDPELYDGDDCMSEWDWQVERPYEVYPLND